jgi:hypothetical protein
MTRQPAWRYHAAEALKAGVAADQARAKVDRLNTARSSRDAGRTPAKGGTA